MGFLEGLEVGLELARRGCRVEAVFVNAMSVRIIDSDTVIGAI